MKESIGVCILLATSLCIATLAIDVASFPMQDPPGGPLSNNDFSPKSPYQQLSMGPSLDNRMRLLLLSWIQNAANQANERMNMKVAKKTCMINAGLSHSCDYKDALAAIDEGMYLGSDQTPGRK